VSKKLPPIRYTDRDFASIKENLLEYAKTYYPDTVKDFNPSSFGMFFLDSVAYVGDMLSFYIDYQASESFFDSSIEYENILRHGREKGFALNASSSAYGDISFYLLVPALSAGLGPDLMYAPILRRLSEFSTRNGSNFVLMEDLDFSDSDKIEVRVARVNDATGVPTYYVLKMKGKAVSGHLISKKVEIGSFKKFLRVEIESNKISEIISVLDSEGNEYFEVPNLAQDVIFKSIINNNSDNVVNIIKPISVPRRFQVVRMLDQTYLQFGYGTDNEVTNDVVDPRNTTLNLFGKTYISDTSFDPNKLLENDKFGIAPSSTVLTVIYRENDQTSSNASVGTVTNSVSPLFRFNNKSSLNSSEVDLVINSLELTNEEPFSGDVSLPSSEELKIRIQNHFATQQRAVTVEDYKALCYSMPPQFGSITRINIFQDRTSFKRNMNIYVISEDSNGKLTTSNNTIKTNLKEWISVHKMVNDTIDIVDAKVVNFGIEFKAVAESKYNRYDILEKCISKLKKDFSIKYDIGEPILISKIYNSLNEVEGVEDVVDVKIVPRNSSSYSQTRFNFNNQISRDGRVIKSFENLIFELRFPNDDIKGTVI
jgi:hypothetical protein